MKNIEVTVIGNEKNGYDYIKYCANGEKIVIARNVKKKNWEEVKELLGADVLEIVPKDYVDTEIDEDMKRSGTYYMDEEARLKETTNVRNNFFKIIEVRKKEQDEFAERMGFVVIEAPMPEHDGIREYDIVGDVIYEKKHNG